MFLLSLNGCGCKKSPYYLEKAPKSDEKVKFIIKEPKVNPDETVQNQ